MTAILLHARKLDAMRTGTIFKTLAETTGGSGCHVVGMVEAGVDMQELQDLSARKDALEVPVGDDSQFVHSLAAHQFQSLDGGSVRRNGGELGEWPHHTLNAGLIPILRSDLFGVFGGDETNGMMIVGDNEAARAAVQQILVDKVAKTDVAG